MKLLRNILSGMLLLMIMHACNPGIDPITKVEPGTDATAPIITVNYPTEGTEIKLPQIVASITIDFEVTDDIEIKEVSVALDGQEIAAYTEFLDYRRFLVDDLIYDEVMDGNHVLTVTAVDMESKSTTVTVNFAKVLPYVPLYEDELLYMPFDGDYMDMITFEYATEVGMPEFATDSKVGTGAYAGASDSYLTFPTENFQNDEFTAVFWLKINAVPDRAGILVMGPEDEANPDAQNNRLSGFRFFRENASGMQRFKLNAGNGTAESWFDGAAAADVDPTVAGWTHFAFTIAPTECKVYINGQIAKEGAFTGIDWTGCDVLSIMSGAPRFTGWSHYSDLSYMDELRIFGRALTQAEIQDIILTESGMTGGYLPKYDGEIFYMPFEDSYLEKVSNTEATVVGTPGYDTGKVGKAYAGAVDSYLTFPTDDLKADEFSAVFWTKINPDPDRAGILTMGPEDTGNANYPDVQNNRTSGFRFFREGSATAQIFKLNAGNGTADTWFDGGATATLGPSATDWVHMAFTISGTECVVYFDGEVVKQGTFDGIDWTGCDILTIMSGVPRFTEWSHFSDASLMDELRLFDKALTQAEIQAIIAAEK